MNQTVDTTYGPFDQVASVKDKRGTVTTTSFHTTADGSCRLTNKPDTVTVSALSGLTNVKLASFCWNADGSLKSQTDYLDATNAAKTRVTTYTYDTSAHLNVQSIIVTGYDGTSVTRSYTYDSLGRKQTEALNRRTSPTNAAQVALTTGYSYDALDRVTQVTDALGNQMQTVFDANGKVSQVVGRYKQPDASFVTRTLSTRSYDAADRMIQDVDVNGNAMLYAYDASGNLIAATDRENHTARYEYDAMNRRTAVIDPNGFRTTTGYDLAGHVISITNGNGETANSQFDAIGRLTRVTDALGFITLYSYDANGNRICMIDSNAQANLQPKNIDGCSESRVFDELNRVVQVKDALNGVTRTAFDLLDNITSITDASNKTTSMSYDGLGRLVSVADPLAKTTAYARDEAGNVYQSTNRKGQVTQTTFDNLNRPILVNYLAANGGDNTAESIAWDSFGNRQSVANSTVNYTFGYDAKSRLTLKTDSRAGRTLSFTYDRADNILTKTDYQNEITAYEYDSANRLIALKNAGYLQASYQYDGAGRLLSRILSNGAQTQYTYDANGWAATLAQKSANGTVLSSTTYTRDRVGNITSQSDTSGTTAYTYDARYWLTNADYPSTAFDETFTYDAVGNRLTHTLGGTTRAYEYLANSNRLATIHTGTLAGQIETSFFYDDEGRLTSQTGIGAKILTWDQKNRAKSASSLAFNYDPMDYRIGKTGGTQGNRAYYLEGEHLEAVYSGQQLQAKYLRGSSTDELLAGYSFDATGNWLPQIYHHDNVMSVSSISTGNGETVQTANYSAFGSLINQSITNINTLRYTGRELDSDTGLYYYRARYYDPAIGRFISEDPLGFQAGINFYRYVDNNPVNGNDPNGEDAHVTVNGNVVNIQIPINYSGNAATPSTIQATNAAIANQWSGTFGRYQVTTTVVPGHWYDFSTNNIALTNGSGISSVSNGNSGTWFQPGQGNPTWEVTHEAGHLMGLPDEYTATVVNGTRITQPTPGFATNIMGAYAQTGVSEQDIASVINANTPWYTKVFNAISDLFSPSDLPSFQVPELVDSFSDIAAGGFLLYPNKPNTNNAVRVYAK